VTSTAYRPASAKVTAGSDSTTPPVAAALDGLINEALERLNSSVENPE
jgi:hypothetical protein